MISVNKGCVKFEGSIVDLQADIALLVNDVNREFSKAVGEEKAKELITHAVEMGFKEVSEVTLATIEKIEKDMKNLREIKEFLERLGK